jgi:mono/diheme cytochrome c family protein
MAPRKTLLAALAVALLILLAGCQNTIKAAAGFRLPDGDPKAGHQVFLDMRCHTCHTVLGGDFPTPTAQPPVPVVLGGERAYVKTDGELVTSIINPSHKIAAGLRPELVQRGDGSRMPTYGELMTVRQMIDVVALLQSRYQVVRPGTAPAH